MYTLEAIYTCAGGRDVLVAIVTALQCFAFSLSFSRKEICGFFLVHFKKSQQIFKLGP